MLRNSIEFADEQFLSLCIAGAGGSEGRSLVALNLAWTWAEQGRACCWSMRIVAGRSCIMHWASTMTAG